MIEVHEIKECYLVNENDVQECINEFAELYANIKNHLYCMSEKDIKKNRDTVVATKGALGVMRAFNLISDREYRKVNGICDSLIASLRRTLHGRKYKAS